MVITEVASTIIEALDAREPPRWLHFEDAYGSEVRLRTRLVDYVQECTAEQRMSQRQFRRARRLEEKADRRPWEEDD